ncbi:MAG: glycosyltransferase [Bacteroidales bacterium]|nr:glycosyltransferase [Candidatus Physcocola equi]
MNNIISVLLPVYKKDNPIFFEESLASILGQTYQDIKVLVGVDGPVDGELSEKLKQIESDARVEVIRFKENRGLACVLNDLVARSRELGVEYLARMDADDISMPDRFEKQMKYLEAHPDIDVTGGKIEEIDQNGDKNGKAVQYPLTHEDCRKFFRYRDPLAHPATFFRMRYFDKAKGYRPEYRKNQDTMLWFDGFMNGCVFGNLPDTVLNFRVAPDFYSRRNGWQRAKQMLTDRMKMNKALGYDLSANIFAFAMFCMTISPTWLKKFLYRIR